MQKSGSQKALKVICIIWIVMAALLILLGIGTAALGAFGLWTVGSSATADASAAAGGVIAAAMGAIFIIAGIIDLIIAIFGLRGANNPAKIGVFFVLCIIGIVVGAIGIISTIAQGNADAMSIVGSTISSLLWPVVCLVLANNIKKENAARY